MSRDLRESTKKQRDQKFRSGVDLHKVGKDSNNKGDKKEIIQEISAVENLTRDEEEPIQKVSEVNQIKEISVIESEDTEIQNIEGSVKTGSSQSLDWDSQADIDSPLKECDLLETSFFEQDFLSPALPKDRSESVSVNRVNLVDLGEEGFGLEPVCRNLNSSFDNYLKEGESDLINQDTLLRRNSNLVGKVTLERIREGDDIIEDEIMDAADYDKNLKAVKQAARRVKLAVDGYNEDAVTLVDKDHFRNELKDIRQVYNSFTEKANSLLDELVEVHVDDGPRVQEVTVVLTEVTASVVENEKKVKKKVAELVAEYEANKPPDKFKQEEKALEAQKLKKRIGYIKEAATDLKKKVLKVKKVKEMSEAEVREGMLKVKDWNAAVAGLIKDKQKADEDSVGTEIEDEEILAMREVVQNAIDAVSNKIENVELEDKERGLFSNAKKHIPKESIVFPEAFEGKTGDNIFEFKEKFEQAIFDSQIREKDRVEVLRKHLKGQPLEMIGKHYNDFEEAMNTLVDNFGHPGQVWNSCKDNIKEKLGGNFAKCWGANGSKQRSLAIARCIEFLKLCKKMESVHEELGNEIYHSTTYNMILALLPNKFRDDIDELVADQSLTYREKFANVEEYLELKRKSAIESERRTVADSYDKKKPETKDFDKRGANYGDGHDGTKDELCKFCDGANCKPEWDAIGCLELYKIKTDQERRDWMLGNSACIKCGADFKERHFCTWGKVPSKRDAACIRNGCQRAAVLCNHKDNMGPKLIKWIKSKINTKHLGIVLIREEKVASKKANTVNEVVKKSLVPISKTVREKLQRGETSMDMSDKELVTLFENDMKNVDKSKPDIREIPEGEVMFIMCVFKGKSRPVLCFVDGGCNCWVATEDLPAKELVSVKLREGPIPMGVAGGSTIYANAEWASLLPLADGGHQVVRGLTVTQVTQDMPKVNLQKIFNSIKTSSDTVPAVKNLKVPKCVGGRIDMILGIRYQNIYPELVHQYSNGLAVYKSKLLPDKPGAVACIGGPVGALEGLIGGNGEHAVLGHLTNLTLELHNYKARVEFFPDSKEYLSYPSNSDLPGIEELINENKNDAEEIHKEKDKDLSHDIFECECCGQGTLPVKHSSAAVQSELEKFMKLNEAGLDASFRCSRCKDCDSCKKGSGYERISIRQEAEQELIKESVHIDEEKGRAIARLPFKMNPEQFLGDNHHIAHKRLQNICRKYYKEKQVRDEIVAAFDKLRKRGHIKFYEDLSVEQVRRLENAKCSYTIPWDVQFKENSLSTPVRTVLDASSKTATGYSLNDTLAVGIPNIVMLVDVLLDFMMGPFAFVGDVSQFYPSVSLEESSWPFQKILIREDINPDGNLKKAVIVACIFGVCSSGGQSEEICRKLSELVKDELPKVADLLTKSRYVDDILKSLKQKEELRKLISDSEKVLGRIQMEVKGWAVAGEKPPEKLSDDGVSVGIPYMTWYPEVDCYKLNISSLHFGKKKRGRFSPDLDIYDPKKHENMETFLRNKSISRRNCTSVVARIPDILGKLAPLTLRFKHDLRKLIQSNPSWDDPITEAHKVRWTSNFKMIEDIRDVMHMRCSIPPGAINLNARVWILCDAAEGGVMVGVYAGFKLANNQYSCENILGKGLLAPEEWTIPRKELSALNTASNIKMVVERALENWVTKIYVGGDSEIALAWCIYENVKLNVFHRNRVNNIRAKVDLEQLHHVLGPENATDVGTRPDAVSHESVLPGSEWLSGKPWMRKSYEEAVAEGIIKPVKDIKLSNDAKKTMKEGVIFDTFDNEESNIAVAQINTLDVQKVAQREAFSNYIFPPLRRSFRPMVRIVSMVLLAVKKFKIGGIRRRVREGKTDAVELKKMETKNPSKFTVFTSQTKEALDNSTKSNILLAKQSVGTGEESLQEVFIIFGVGCTGLERSTKQPKSVLLKLTDENLSDGLEYLFRKATKEIIEFENVKEVEKISVMKDDILFCNSRILESQELKAVGCLEGNIDMESFTGVKFFVPLVSKNSPLAVSLAIHIHYNVKKHCGVESTYRTSLNHARILQGKQIFKEVGDDCIYCKKLRLRYTKQLMGPLADTQLTVSPIFFFSYVDMWGPIMLYTPGYEHRTRNRKMEYEAHMLVIGCAVTGAINCQIIEKRDTAAVLDGLNRFFCECSVPKIMYPDMDGALMKALTLGEMNIVDLQGRLLKERGIQFSTCLPQGHSSHGRIERRIRMIQETLTKSNLRNSRNTATGWQTIAKLIEKEVNNVPLGYLYHQGTANPLLKVLCPSILKNGTFSDRAPKDIFQIPNSEEDLMKKIIDKYNMWFRIWNTEYVPLIMDRQKWYKEEENLQPNDVIYFKLTDSALASDWRLGKVEFVKEGRDGKVREVGIAYKSQDLADNKWKHNVVQRPVRNVVKLWNIEDTSFLENMKEVQNLVKEILFENKEHQDEESKAKNDGLKEKKRRTELEKLKIDNEEFKHLPSKRLRKPEDSVDAASLYTNVMRSFIEHENSIDDEEVFEKDKNTANCLTGCKDSPVVLMRVTGECRSIVWPERIQRDSDIGLTTNAILDGVTEHIVRGSSVVREQGQIYRNIQGGVKLNNMDQKNIEADDYVKHCHSVFLL